MRERCTRTSTASCPLRSGRRSRLTSRTARRVARTSPKSGRCANESPHCWDLLGRPSRSRSEEHTSELQSRGHLVCRLLLEKKKNKEKHKSRHRFKDRL